MQTETQIIQTYGIERAVALYQGHKKVLEELSDLHDRGKDIGFPLEITAGRLGDAYGRANFRAHQYRLLQATWNKLLIDTNVKQHMDANRREKFDKLLYCDRRNYYHLESTAEELPDFTVENVEAFLRGMVHDAPSMFEDSVDQLARALNWNYKTNRPGAFGQRMICEFQGSDYPAFRLRYDSKVVDLHRLLCVLSKVPLPDSNTSIHSLHARDWIDAPLTKPETPVLLSLKVFKNKNVHVQIHNPEHVNQLNRVLAKRYPATLTTTKK